MLKIEYIIETHLHADFVSGHRANSPTAPEHTSISVPDRALNSPMSQTGHRWRRGFSSATAASGSCKLLDTHPRAYRYS